MKLKEAFNREQFRPSVFGLFLNPFYFARKGLFEHISALAPHVTGRVLDVGCGRKPYESLFRASCYIGLEIDTVQNRKNNKADYFYDGTTFPFGDAEFDSVILNQVFEHVFNPEPFLREVKRVLKDGGILLMSVPFVWDEHEQPCDYARYSSFGLRSVLENNDFVIMEQRKSINDIRVIFQLLNTYLYKITVTGNKIADLLATIVLMAPFNILGALLAKLLPNNDDLYLDNIILAKKVEDA